MSPVQGTVPCDKEEAHRRVHGAGVEKPDFRRCTGRISAERLSELGEGCPDSLLRARGSGCEKVLELLADHGLASSHTISQLGDPGQVT